MSAKVRKNLSWVAVDWGSSNLRAWALDEAGSVLAQGSSGQGALTLTSGAYEAALMAIIDEWLPKRDAVTVMVCGMAGARQGWCETPYRTVPLSLDSMCDGAMTISMSDPRLRVHLLPGVCQTSDGSGRDWDIMRGEETQLAGLIALEAGMSGVVCLPGTHSKWACLESGNLMGFRTYLSGEIFQLLLNRSVLTNSLLEDSLSDPDSRDAFIKAVRDVNTNPQRFTNLLFGIRATDLLNVSFPRGPARARQLSARLSGLVIGLELADVLRDLSSGERILLIGAEKLCERYLLAFEALGLSGRVVNSQTVLLAGLRLAKGYL